VASLGRLIAAGRMSLKQSVRPATSLSATVITSVRPSAMTLAQIDGEWAAVFSCADRVRLLLTAAIMVLSHDGGGAR